MNRFDRITSILIHLQSKRVVTANEMAGRFEVSLRTIYRDIRTLEEAGVPIMSEVGVGYSIMEGYRLPPIMFSREEAISFVASEKLVENFTDQTTRNHYQSAIFKIKSVLNESQKDLLTNLESNIEVNSVQELFNASIHNTLDILFKSIAARKAVNIKYKAFYSDDFTERIIEPVGLFHENNYWYMVGFCHLRQDYRHFRTDRMEGINLTNISFHKQHAQMKEYRKKPDAQKEKIKVVISIDKIVYRYMKEKWHYYGYMSEEWKEDSVLITFMTEEILEGFPRWFLMYADYAKIIEPESLKLQVKMLLKKIENNM